MTNALSPRWNCMSSTWLFGRMLIAAMFPKEFNALPWKSMAHSKYFRKSGIRCPLIPNESGLIVISKDGKKITSKACKIHWRQSANTKKTPMRENESMQR